MVTKSEFHFISNTGVCDIYGCAYLPDVFDTVLCIHHGMAEHQGRYAGFIDFLNQKGVAVYMHDMANHGKSNKDYEKSGWFGDKDGWKGLVEDFRQVIKKAKEENPGKKLVVMGHSMGSFICRLYVAKYPEDGFDGAIFMGTGGANGAAAAGKAAASLLGTLQGKLHKSNILNNMAFGSYGKRFEGRTPFDWLTRDQSIVDKYIEDPYCGFLFTIRGMHDLITVNAASNEDDFYNGVPADLPVLVTSGAEDPVGDYGKGIDKVVEKLKQTGHTKITEMLYPDCRHEILNELNKDQVMADILGWIKDIKAAKEA